MRKSFLVLSIALLSLLSACTSTTINPATQAATTKARQAQQWLTAQPKWVVSRASENNIVFYERGVQQVGDADMEVDWLRFLPDNRFEVQMLGDAKPESLFYKIDGNTNEFIVSETADFTKPLSWNTTIDNIHEKSVDLFIREGSKDLLTLTLVPQP